MTELQRQAEAYAGVRARLMNAPVVKRVKTEAYFEEKIAVLREVIANLRSNMGEMKAEIRKRDVEIAKLNVALSLTGGQPIEDTVSMRDICEDVLAKNYPGVTFQMIQKDVRSASQCKARHHCFYEVYVLRPDLKMSEKARFFGRDQSAYRHGIRRYASTIGVEILTPGEKSHGYR
jgi:hypothetical protein